MDKGAVWKVGLGFLAVAMKPSKIAERIARNAVEAAGFVVHDANLLFGENCPNIDLVAFGPESAIYVQVKLSSKPARKDAVLIHGAPWTKSELFEKAPIFNKKKDAPQASAVIVVHLEKDGPTLYVARPADLEELARPLARKFARKPKKDGGERRMFRKEVHKEVLRPFLNNWVLFRLIMSGQG